MYATLNDEYIQTPGKVEYAKLEEKWKLTHQSLIAHVYRSNLAARRRDFWDAIYHKARQASQEELEQQFFAMVKDLKARRDRLVKIVATGKPHEAIRASDGLGNVARDLLKARGWPTDERMEEAHNLFVHPENV